MKLLSVLFVLLLLSSCQNYQCPEFDKKHPINKWDWFPEANNTYIFLNNKQQEIEVVQTRYESTPSREFSCHACACIQDLKTYYTIPTLNIEFRCTLLYQGGGDDKAKDDGGIYYGIDRLGSPFSPHPQTVTEVEIPDYEFKEFNVTYSDSLKILNNTYLTVTELHVLDTTKSKIQKLWIVPNQGIVGFRVNNTDWIKK